MFTQQLISELHFVTLLSSPRQIEYVNKEQYLIRMSLMIIVVT